VLLGEQDAEHLQNLGEDAKVRGCCADLAVHLAAFQCSAAGCRWLQGCVSGTRLQHSCDLLRLS